jgi:DNA-binding HxlR family transcriptional regulator
MARINFTLKDVTREIRKAEKKLRAIRRKVSKADQRWIDLSLRGLEKSYAILRRPCRPNFRFGHSFLIKPK